MTTNRRAVILSWSSGKDSAWSLYQLRKQPGVDVVALLTTFNESANRVAVHAVRRRLVAQQAESLKLPLIPVELPWPCPNDAYEDAMESVLKRATEIFDAKIVAFGDLFLTDIRSYREKQMTNWNLEPLFPIWNLPTPALARELVESGLKAIITCVDPRQCPREFAGRHYDHDLLDELPAHVDPCGENGEFHTFVYDGPMFRTPIDVLTGVIVERDGFVFADLLPAAA